MKAIITSCIMIAMLCSVAHAQSPVFIGLRGGANLSHANSDAFSGKYNFGWEVGAYAGIRLIPKLGVQAEALYSWTKLTTVDYTKTDGTGIKAGKQSLNYFSIPLLLRLNITPNFAINAGPQLNILTNSSSHLLDNNQEAFKKRSTAWVAGFEITSAASKTYLYGRATWGSGVEKINDDKDANVLRFQLGIVVPLIGNKDL